MRNALEVVGFAGCFMQMPYVHPVIQFDMEGKWRLKG